MRQAIILSMVIALFAIPSIAEESKAVLLSGSPPPSFLLPDLSGKTVTLEKSLGQRATILSFFASWSKSCQEEIKFLKGVEKDENLKIVAVSFDRTLKELKEFATKNSIKFTILHDKKLTTLKDYRILIIPTLLVIDQDGNVTNIYVDFDDNVKEAVAKEIEKLLSPKKK